MSSTPSPAKKSMLQRDYLSVSPSFAHRDIERSRSLPPRRQSPLPAKSAIRKRLGQYHTIDDATKLLKGCENVVVLTGAGISTSLGIPDFRSKHGGFYSMLQNKGFDDPQDFFHIDNFYNDPAGFYRTASVIIPAMKDDTAVPKYSLTHAFLALLQGKRKLLTNYTQNIDGLESAAGVDTAKIIRCHGSWETASCITCGKQKPAKKYLPVVYQNNVPYCKCSQAVVSKPRARSQPGKKRKRSEWDDTGSEDDGVEPPRGLLKPDITFFGEGISDAYRPRLKSDRREVDLLLIIGTSLKVRPVSDMLVQVPPDVPQVWISRERCQVDGVKVDIELLGDCDVVIEELCRRAGWTKDLQSRLWNSSSDVKKNGKADGHAQETPPSDTIVVEAPQPETQSRKENIVADEAIAPGQTTFPKSGGPSTQIDEHNENGSSKKPDENPETPNGTLSVLDTLTHTARDLANAAVPDPSSPTLVDRTKSAISQALGVRKGGGTANKPVTSPIRDGGTVVVEQDMGTDWRWFIKKPK